MISLLGRCTSDQKGPNRSYALLNRHLIQMIPSYVYSVTKKATRANVFLRFRTGRQDEKPFILRCYRCIHFWCLLGTAPWVRSEQPVLISHSNTVSIPLYSDMRKQMNYSSFILDASYAANSATLAIACVIFVPFALVLGRRVVYIVTSLIVLASTIWSARTQTAGEVLGSTILQGFAGSVNESLFQLTVSFRIHSVRACH